MKTLLVTSRVTFVPENYARFVCGMAASPHISAVLFLENRDLRTVVMGAAFWASRLAPGIGASLLRNSAASLRDSREAPFIVAGKPVFSLKDINSPDAIEILKGFDLVVNARTRYIYSKAALGAPRIGCINIHHGLLPEQRGLFCDLWALSEGRPAGFSIHRMTPKLDDGDILDCTEVKHSASESFLAHTLKSSTEELHAMEKVLDQIAEKQSIEGRPNTRSSQTKYYRNPTSAEILALRKRGFYL